MDEKTITMIAGVLLSLLFSYVPGLRAWFDKHSGDIKRLIMLGALLAVSLGAFGLACIGRLDAVSCSVDGAWDMLELFVLAAIANQTAYQLTPRGGEQ